MSQQSVSRTLSSHHDGRQSERDGKVPGLQLRHGKTRSVWYLFYRVRATGRQRCYRIGDSRIYSRSKARERAIEILADVGRGADPAAQVADAGAGRTITDLYDRVREQMQTRVKAKTWEQCYEPAWRLYILPRFGKRHVADIKMADAVDLHHRLRAKPYQANRVIAVLHRAFELSERWGWRPLHSNPIVVERYPEQQRRRVPTLDEAVRLSRAMAAMRKSQPWFIGMIDLLILTGCRKSEIMTARHDWVQPDGLHLPDSKTGERIIPLSQQARAIIASLPREKDNHHIIVGRHQGTHLTDPKGLWSQLLAAAKIEDMRMHDLRRYFASAGLTAGLTLEQVGQLLGHRQFQTTKRYAYLSNTAGQAAAQQAAELVANPRKMLADALRQHRSAAGGNDRGRRG